MTSHVTHIIEKETVYTWIFSWERDLGKGITNRFLCRYEETQLILASVTNSLVPIRGSPDIGHIFNCLYLLAPFCWLSQLCASLWIGFTLILILNWMQQFQTHDPWTVTSEEGKSFQKFLLKTMVGAPQHASSHNSWARIFTCLIADERNEFTLQSELCLEGLRESLLDRQLAMSTYSISFCRILLKISTIFYSLFYIWHLSWLLIHSNSSINTAE